jgi:hypothetical protein
MAWQSELDCCHVLPPGVAVCGKLALKPYVPAELRVVKMLLKLPLPLAVVVVTMSEKPSEPFGRTCSWTVWPFGTAGLAETCPEMSTFVCPVARVFNLVAVVSA